MELLPTDDELKTWLLSTLQHASHFEYFRWRLDIGHNDPQMPHDLVGLGNKYEWEVAKGFALQFRNPKPDFQTYILPSLTQHRQQIHHQKWNEPSPDDITKPALGATPDDMHIGAVDAICSLLENRGYQGGVHDYDGIIEITKKNPPHKIPWMLEMLPKMKALKQPRIDLITSLEDIPNIGLTPSVYDDIVRRTQEAAEMFRRFYGYRLAR